ncbi:aminoglycoside phosphotransferase [Cyanobium sp. PCC 7001]|uniref:T3SS effector HopA1 family protein n=1 Tax=Cyanobium sp. PCC 7001 TaxID=180281 RepID=UPI0001805C0B|nr:T3SS effector HopA1 family protein [Cyanobium sp. PCC 7001]EDY38371.1 aminoglycoside phosphotransferase [Cyanobium sp. PCC 7001]
MPFRLESGNVFRYLVGRGLCAEDDQLTATDQLVGKNANLLVEVETFSSQGKTKNRFIVKQAPLKADGSPKEDFGEEWQIYQLLCRQGPLPPRAILPEGIAYDAASSILIHRYLDPYEDLGDFYTDTRQFPLKIATSLGIALASLHASTFEQDAFRQQLTSDLATESIPADQQPDFRSSLEDLTPDIFTHVSQDALKFYRLYQRSRDLSEALRSLEADHRACCLIHNDLRFHNVLLHQDWRTWQAQVLPTSTLGLQLCDGQGVVRIIDWEQCLWGDPALDVGALVAEYLRIWLKSLMLSRDIDLAVALRLASVPLEQLQPSLYTFLQAYLAQFPKILAAFPDFTERVTRFAGLGLIGSIQDRIYYREPFGNIEIAMLQVARSLLCDPATSLATVFGHRTISPASFDPLVIRSEPDIPALSGPLHPSSQEPHEPTQTCPAEQTSPADEWTAHDSQETAVADLINNIRVEPLLIAHPHYAPLNLVDGAPIPMAGPVETLLDSLPAEQRETYVLHQLRNYLYDIYFSGDRARRWPDHAPARAMVNNTVAGLDVDFVDRIKAANSGSGFIDHGWTVTRVGGRGAQIEKDGLHLWIDPDVDLSLAMVLAGHARPEASVPPTLSEGANVGVHMPNACLAGERYIAIGNAGGPAADQPHALWFFHIDAEGALLLMKIFTSDLNRSAVPFRLSILTDPQAYHRYDAARLELGCRHYAHARTILETSYPQLRSHLNNPVPLFSKTLGLGIGLGESEGDGDDFGLRRCQIVARALLASTADAEQRLAAIQQHFKQNGLNWRQPHRTASSQLDDGFVLDNQPLQEATATP